MAKRPKFSESTLLFSLSVRRASVSRARTPAERSFSPIMTAAPASARSLCVFVLVVVGDVRGRDEYRRLSEGGKLRYRHCPRAVYHNVCGGKAHRHIVDVIDKLKIRVPVKSETVEFLPCLRVIRDPALVQVVYLRVL